MNETSAPLARGSSEFDAGVVRALRRRITGGRKAERTAVLVEEVFLLEAEPGARVVQDGRALVRGVRGDARAAA